MTQRPDSPNSSHDPPSPSASSVPDPWSADHANAAPPGDLVGLRAGPYELVAYIDGGAMGEVYRARRRGRHRQWAVKVLRPVDTEVEGIIQESIDHPHVVRVDDIGTMEDREGRTRPYIAMELFGHDAALHRWVATHNPSIAERCRLVEEAARGVAYMNGLGYLHHDLKPNNILVDRYGSAKVADFGLAQLRLESEHAFAGGTYAYQSPEQCHQTAIELDERSDVYGLGATLFSVLADGAVPVPISPGSTREGVYRDKIERPPRLDLLPPETPGSIRTVLERSLAPQRETRVESAAEFAKELARARIATQGVRGCARARYASAWRKRPRMTGWLHATILAVLATIMLTTPGRHVTSYEAGFLARLPAVDASLPARYETVRMVRLPDRSSRGRIPELATALLEGMDPAQRADSRLDRVRIAPVQTWRPIYGAFIDAMSEAGARSITLDMYLPTERADLDPALSDAIRRAEERAVPVIVGANWWAVDAQGQPRISSAIWAGRPRWGCLLVDGKGVPVVPLAAGPGGEHWQPSLALATYAAARHPDARPEIVLRDRSLRLRYWTPGDFPGERVYTGVEAFLPVLTVANTSDLRRDLWNGREEDWQTTYIQRTILEMQAIDEATLGFVELLEMTPDQRKEAVGGRVLVVFDPTWDRTFDMQLDRPIFGGELQASAIEAMLQGRTSRWAGGWQALLASAIAASIAASIGVLVWGGRWSGTRRHVVTAIALCGLVALMLVAADAALVWVYKARGLIILPVAPALAVILGAALALAFPIAVAPRRKPITELPDRPIQELLFPNTGEV